MKNLNNENALYIAEENFNHDVIAYLKEKGATESKKFIESESVKRSRIMNAALYN